MSQLAQHAIAAIVRAGYRYDPRGKAAILAIDPAATLTVTTPDSTTTIPLADATLIVRTSAYTSPNVAQIVTLADGSMLAWDVADDGDGALPGDWSRLVDFSLGAGERGA